MKVVSSRILIDTSVIVDFLRGNIGAEVWLRTLEGRAPTVSPVTLHELRRGIAPGSKLDSQMNLLMPADSILSAPPMTEDWIESADIIRTHFGKVRSKIELATLAHDTLIGLAARSIRAELWSRDKDFRVICNVISVSLLGH